MSDRITLLCWKCGTQLLNLLLPFSRSDECSACNADLHCCLSCKNYSSALSDNCTQDRADFVLEKEKANFCEFFDPSPNAFIESDNSAAELARVKLAELFGENPNLDDSTAKSNASPQSDAEKALEELNRLFDKD